MSCKVLLTHKFLFVPSSRFSYTACLSSQSTSGKLSSPQTETLHSLDNCNISPPLWHCFFCLYDFVVPWTYFSRNNTLFIFMCGSITLSVISFNLICVKKCCNLLLFHFIVFPITMTVYLYINIWIWVCMPMHSREKASAEWQISFCKALST